jgi:ATP-dependent DNA helicase RecG
MEIAFCTSIFEMKTLKELIASGESSHLEFKSEQLKPEDLAKEIVAFLNFQGGKILIGVEDDGKVSGVTRPDIEEWVMNICRSNIVPPLIPVYHTLKEDNKFVVVLEIPGGLAKPYHTQKGDYYIRTGSTSRKASREELSRLFQDSGMMHDELTPIPGTDSAGLDEQKLRDYFLNQHPAHVDFSEEESDTKNKILQNQDILSSDGRITVVGMLMFGLQPARFLPQSEVLFAHFKGKEIGDELIDRKNLIGTLPQIIEDAQRVIQLNVQNASKIVGMKRVEKVIFPDKVIRELLVNALIHRRWRLMGNIRIFLFADRLQIRSPGKLPNGVTIEKMKESTHVPRNPLLMKFMQDYHFVEKLGRGIPMVVREMKKLTGREPDFAESGEEFSVTLHR